jgi:anhydro-N-acetylmuramic acid kinase
MKKKIFTSLGLMSGTSLDGVDISVVKSDGFNHVEVIFNDYVEFDKNLYSELTDLREKISKLEDLNNFLKKIDQIEKKFTIFNSIIVKKVIEENSFKIDLIGFHGQTILHLPKNKISKQIGEGSLLSFLTKCKVVSKFRQMDLDSGGQGAPLAPIYHNQLSKIINNKFKLNYPMSIINIGGITNVSKILNEKNLEKNLFAYDIAPGNCLIDLWIRKHSGKKFDHNGDLAKCGKVDNLILNQAIDNFEICSIDNSLDTKNFDLSFVRGLNFEDGCATITKFTAYLISEGIKKIDQQTNSISKNYLVCGGGRKNETLIQNINQFMGKNVILKNIDQYKIGGDFIESQAFAYLAIRSYLNLPISFPQTTRCKKPTSGGVLVKNFN